MIETIPGRRDSGQAVRRWTRDIKDTFSTRMAHGLYSGVAQNWQSVESLLCWSPESHVQQRPASWIYEIRCMNILETISFVCIRGLFLCPQFRFCFEFLDRNGYIRSIPKYLQRLVKGACHCDSTHMRALKSIISHENGFECLTWPSRLIQPKLGIYFRNGKGGLNNNDLITHRVAIGLFKNGSKRHNPRVVNFFFSD